MSTRSFLLTKLSGSANSEENRGQNEAVRCLCLFTANLGIMTIIISAHLFDMLSIYVVYPTILLCFPQFSLRFKKL